MCADDIDFIDLANVNIKELLKIQGKYQLRVNIDKTDLTTLSRNENMWMNRLPKNGSLIGQL